MHIKRHSLSIGFLVYSLTLVAGILSTNANAATYYISPTGSNSNAGTSLSTPWQTFSVAILKLRPGDTLILLDGTYTNANSGLPQVSCGSNATNGTASQPITIKAQNERQAHLQGSGTVVFKIYGCAYWVIEGLYASNIDVQVSGYDGSTFVVDRSNHITLRRNLAYGPNAWFNSHGISLYYTNNSLIEENEVYYVARHGFILFGPPNPDGNILRRNYANSRNHADMPGGVTYPGVFPTDRGDTAFTCYPCKNTIFENNIAENWYTGHDLQAKTDAIKNKYLGNIVMDSDNGFGFTARSDLSKNTADQMPTDSVLINNLALRMQRIGGFGMATAKNTQMTNNSALDGKAHGVSANVSRGPGEQGDGNASFFGTNLLIVNNTGYGFKVYNQANWSLDHTILFGNGNVAYPGLADSHYSNILTTNPNLGTCKVFIPNGSPAKGGGVGGADIGANILYRYQDGVLTQTPLWDLTTGRFPCGAQVAGVNDIAGSSCVDVHKRLNVNTNGCTLPTAAFPGPTLRKLGFQP